MKNKVMKILLLFAISTFHIKNVFCTYYTETVELEDLETMFWKQWYCNFGNMLKAREESSSTSEGRKMFICDHGNKVKEIIIALSNRDGFIGNQDIFLRRADIKHYLSVFSERLTKTRTLMQVIPWKINFYAMHSDFRFTIEEYAILMTKPSLENNPETDDKIYLAMIPSYNDKLQLLGYYILGRHASLPDPNLYGEGIVAFAHYETKSIYHVSKKLSENIVTNWKRPEIHFTSKSDLILQRKQREIQLKVLAKEGHEQGMVSPNIRFLIEKYGPISYESFSRKGSEAGPSSSSSQEKTQKKTLNIFAGGKIPRAEKLNVENSPLSKSENPPRYYTETVALEDLETMFWKQWFDTEDNMSKAQKQAHSTSEGQRTFIINHSYNVKEILIANSNRDGFIGNPDIFLNRKDIEYDLTFGERFIETKTSVLVLPWEINFYAMHSKFQFTIEEDAIIMMKPFHQKENDADAKFLAVIPSYSDELQLLGYYILGRHASSQNLQEEGIVAFAHYETKSIYHVSKKLTENCAANDGKRPKIRFTNKHDCVSKRHEIQLQLISKEARNREKVSPNVQFLMQKYGPKTSKSISRGNAEAGLSSRDKKRARVRSSRASLRRNSANPVEIASTPKSEIASTPVANYSSIKKYSGLLVVCCLFVGYYLLKETKKNVRSN